MITEKKLKNNRYLSDKIIKNQKNNEIKIIINTKNLKIIFQDSKHQLTYYILFIKHFNEYNVNLFILVKHLMLSLYHYLILYLTWIDLNQME